jgi:hypothetical protein
MHMQTYCALDWLSVGARTNPAKWSARIYLDEKANERKKAQAGIPFGRPPSERLGCLTTIGSLGQSRRRQELLELLDRLNPTIEDLTAAVEQEASERRLLITLTQSPAFGSQTCSIAMFACPNEFFETEN